MASEEKSKGRAYLVKQLQGQGVSRRRAVRLLNLVFRQMSQALKRGKEVEFPFGKLKRVRYDSARYLDLAEDWSGCRQVYTVIHELDEAGARLLFPEGWASGPEASPPAPAERPQAGIKNGTI
jgi:hypothetical protein